MVSQTANYLPTFWSNNFWKHIWRILICDEKRLEVLNVRDVRIPVYKCATLDNYHQLVIDCTDLRLADRLKLGMVVAIILSWSLRGPVHGLIFTLLYGCKSAHGSIDGRADLLVVYVSLHMLFFAHVWSNLSCIKLLLRDNYLFKHQGRVTR